MTAAGVVDTKMHIAGESARYLDITDINKRDTWQVMIIDDHSHFNYAWSCKQDRSLHQFI